MAKHRKQKKKSAQANPLQKPVIDEKLRQERILPIIASLKSTNPAERTVALGALANVSEDATMRHMLLRERLLQVIMSNTLSDSSWEIVAEGLGVLRNIVLAEGRDPAVFLIREHINTSLSSMALKSRQTLAELNTLDKVKLETVNQMMENVFGLVTAIAIAQEEPIEASEVVILVTELLMAKHEKITKQTYDAAFEVLYYLSEDNEQLLGSLSSSEKLRALKSTAQILDTWQAKTYALGIECSSVFSNDNAPPEAIANVVNALIVHFKNVPATEINSLHVCLELLALTAQSADSNVASQLLFEAVPRALEFLDQPEYALRSVSFVNNVGWTLDGLKADWASEAHVVFDHIVASGLDPSGDGELVTSKLGSLNAAIIQSKDLVSDSRFVQALPRLFERVDTLYREQDEEWIALASALVNLLSGVAAIIDVVSTTSDLIFSLLEFATSVQSQIDALNGLFDLFGDNESPFNEQDYNNKQLNLKLEQLRPKIKRILKSPSKSDAFLKDQADDALLNLDNFIIYKRG